MLHAPPTRDHTIVVRVDADLADFIKSEAAREYTSMSGLLARLAADRRRARSNPSTLDQEAA